MKQLLIVSFGVMAIGLISPVNAATITYGFDDGTFQGWDYITPPDGLPFPEDESDSGWAPSAEPIDIGDGFTLLPATSGDFRIVPDPWESRDCIGLVCLTQILRSPTFFLDGSGDLSIDMIGGAARSNSPFDPEAEDPPSDPEWFFEQKDGSGLQGFALLDVAAQEYVALGFSTGENDGKARPTDPEHRAVWETVTLSEDTLSPFANDGKQYAIDVFDSYAGAWGWIGFDTVVIPGSSTEGLAGDFDGDGELGASDIDELSDMILMGTNDAKYDVDGSGTVDAADRTHWVEKLRNTYFGDANLDNEFNSSDFVTVFVAGEYEDDEPLNSGWAEGDWNGDKDFGSSDFVAAFSSGGYEQGPRAVGVNVVPEPSGLGLAAFGFLMLFGRRRC